ncbi:MAG: hypothetical protein J6V11_01565 [Alphaproteobacteria bacterium]|nr:hypothetical protein [Alphaproteobacteria bacterium]
MPTGTHPQGVVSLTAQHWLKPEPTSPVQTAIPINYKNRQTAVFCNWSE